MVHLCWNCTLPQDEGAAFCEGCGQPVQPDATQARVLAERVAYLLSELEQWSSLPTRQREGLLAEYRGRQDRLLELAGDPPRPRAVPLAPEPEPPEPESEKPEPLPVESPEPVAVSPLACELSPRTPRLAALGQRAEEKPHLLENVSGFLQEKNIRWFHYLGAMLLFTSGVGYLRSQWDGAGKQLVALLLVLSPALFFWLADRARERLPVSSRLFSVLGGLLMPSGLLAANQFHLLGMNLPARQWSAFSFAVTAGVVLSLASRLQEVACLYLGSLSLFLAVVTGAPSAVVSGILSMGLAAIFLYLGRQAGPESPFRPHYYGISQGLAGLGLSCALPALARGPSVSPLLVLLFGSLFFASSAYLTGGAQGLKVSAAVASVTGFLAVRWLGLGPAALGLLALVFGSFYLTAARNLPREEEELIDLSYRLGSGLTGLLVALGLGWELLSGAFDNFAHVPRGQLFASLVVALLACFYYASVAWLYRRPGWVYASAATAAYAWFLGTVVLWQPRPELYSLSLVILSLLWQLAVWRLPVEREFLTPAVRIATLVASLAGPLLWLQQFSGHFSPAPGVVWGAMTAVYALSAAWNREARLLYVGALCLLVSYFQFLPYRLNLGLTLLPLVGGMGALALAVSRKVGREFGLPLARTALVLGFAGALWQFPMAWREPASVPSTLLGYTLAFALAGWLYADWDWLQRPAREGLWTLACLCLPGAVLVSQGAWPLVATAVLMLAASAVLRATLARPGLELAALSWVAWLPLLHGNAPLGATAPLVWTLAVWLAAELQSRALPAVLLGALLLTLPTLASVDSRLWQLALSALLVARAGWKLDWGAPAWAGGMLGGLAWGLACEKVGLKALPPVWWLLQVFLGGCGWAAARTQRPRLSLELGRVNLATGVLVLLSSLFSAEHWSVLTPAFYAVLALAWGWRRQHLNALGAGAILGALGAFELAMRVHVQLGLLWALWGLVLVALEALSWPEGARWLSRFTLGLGLVAGGLGFVQLGANPAEARLILVAAGALFGVRGWRSRSALDAWLTFGWLYVAYLSWLPDSVPGELRSWPLALWLLGWSERWQEDKARACGALGVLLVLAPSLLGSLGPQGLGHALAAMVAGLALVFVGMARERSLLRTAGGLGVLAEIAIQALHVAVLLPWQLVAAVVGVLLVTLGALFERRRQHRAQSTPQDSVR